MIYRNIPKIKSYAPGGNGIPPTAQPLNGRHIINVCIHKHSAQVYAHKLIDAHPQTWRGPCRDREDGALIKQLCRFMTCKLEDGQMDGWKDGSMEGQNKKMKGLRQREKDGRTGGQTNDGCTDDRWWKKTAERTALR